MIAPISPSAIVLAEHELASRGVLNPTYEAVASHLNVDVVSVLESYLRHTQDEFAEAMASCPLCDLS